MELQAQFINLKSKQSSKDFRIITLLNVLNRFFIVLYFRASNSSSTSLPHLSRKSVKYSSVSMNSLSNKSFWNLHKSILNLSTLQFTSYTPQ